MRRNDKNWFIIFFIAISVLFVFVPTKGDVQAEGATEWVLGQVGSGFFNTITNWVLQWLGDLLAFIMTFFQWLLSFSMGFYEVGVVNAGWTVMRDFANMFFIVALIIMAFATIFNVSGYDFRSMIGRFLVAAVVMNFSLVLSKLFLKFTDVISNVFITALGDVSGQLGQALSPGVTVANGNNLANINAFAQAGITTGLTGIFAIIFVGILLVSMSTAAAFIFVRIPILWYVMIFAPIAIVLNIFPGTKKSFSSWLNMLLGWGLYLPIFLFYLYFGMFFLSRQGDILAVIGKDAFSGSPIKAGFVSFQVAFTYFLACFFILGGVKIANSTSFIASAHVTDWSKKPFQWASQRVGVTGAWQKRKAQFQEEGLRGKFLGMNLDRFNWAYGGKQALERREARFGRLFGSKGMETVQQRQFLDRVKKETEDIEQKINNGDLNDTQIVDMAKQGNASDPKTYAIRRIAAQRGQLDGTLFRNTIQELGDNRLAAQDFAKAAKESDFSAISAKDQLSIASDRTTPIPVRREMYQHIATQPKVLAEMDPTQVPEAISILGGSTSKAGKDFLEGLNKTRPDLVIDYKMGTPDLANEIKGVPEHAGLSDEGIKVKLYEGAMKDVKTISEMPVKVWNIREFRRALSRRIKGGSAKSNRNFVDKMYNQLRFVRNADEKRVIFSRLVAMSGIYPPIRGTGGGGGGGTGAAPRSSTGTPPPAPTTPSRRQIGFGPIASVPREVLTPSEPPRVVMTIPEEINSDPRFQNILQQKSLEYLKTKDQDYFYSYYSGDLSPEGYLIDKVGKNTNSLPSQEITAGFPEVKQNAYVEFMKRYK